ncbi:MAG: hypothetical protein O6826_08365 [Acidobacteria bacterium]|nr:hypothetical protein [Acidobacteriota bacterium]
MHSKARILTSVLLLVSGLVIELTVLDIIPIDENLVHAPNWVISLLGILFLSSGLVVVVSPESSIASWSAGTLVIAMTLVSAWVAVYGSSEHFSGDLPFISQDTNVIIARIIFGCVSLLGLAIILAAAKKTWGRGDA